MYKSIKTNRYSTDIIKQLVEFDKIILKTNEGERPQKEASLSVYQREKWFLFLLDTHTCGDLLTVETVGGWKTDRVDNQEKPNHQ